MRLVKQVLAALAVVVVFAAIAAFVAPQRAHAVVAALVQVTNTADNPISMISANAHNSFVAENHCNFNGEFCQVSPVYSVPAGQVAVVDSVTALCFLSSGVAPLGLELQFDGPDGQPDDVDIPAGPVVNGAFVVGQNITTYVPGGSRGSGIAISAITGSIEPSGDCRLGISGHLEPQ